MPARAPPSMLMLQMVMRFHVERADRRPAILEHVAGSACTTPIRPMMPEDQVFRGDAGGERVRHFDREGLRPPLQQALVASTWPTSVVPMPKARAPNALLVWLSPQTMVLPGRVRPSSGPMMCTMPRRSCRRLEQLDAEFGIVLLEFADLLCRRFNGDGGVAEDLLGARASNDPLSQASGPACEREGLAAQHGRPAARSPRGSGGGR